MTRLNRTITGAGFAAVLLLATMPLIANASQGGPEPVNDSTGYAARIHFVKHVVDPVAFKFEGTTTGAATGILHSNLVAQLGSSGDYGLVSFRWEVSAGRHSFVAETVGTLNNATGAVSMSGKVVSGWSAGAKVLELGQGDGKGNFEGDIVILLP